MAGDGPKAVTLLQGSWGHALRAARRDTFSGSHRPAVPLLLLLLF